MNVAPMSDLFCILPALQSIKVFGTQALQALLALYSNPLASGNAELFVAQTTFLRKIWLWKNRRKKIRSAAVSFYSPETIKSFSQFSLIRCIKIKFDAKLRQLFLTIRHFVREKPPISEIFCTNNQIVYRFMLKGVER